ncbi:hypothetical protein P3L10_014091 [Capsicum annuum]
MEIFNISGLREIDFSFNNLSGSLPPNMCSILRNIERLSGWLNQSCWYHSSFYLQLFKNYYSRSPRQQTQWFDSQFSWIFDSSTNSKLGEKQFNQRLFRFNLRNITSLREIHLGSNKLSSNIPPSLRNLQDLVVLDLSSNNMNLAHLTQ